MSTDDDLLRLSHVERQIRQAMGRGEFDELDGAGRPLAILAEPYHPSWWARRWVERDRLADRPRMVVE